MDTLANFFVIGAAKGGTTSLYHYLNQHPSIFLTPIKETNFFARLDIDESRLDPVYQKDIKLNFQDYVKRGMKDTVHIAHVKKPEDYQTLFSAVQSESIIGEISNSYAVSPHALELINEYNPMARIVMMLRNPIDRIWSHYLMNIREAKTIHSDFISEVRIDHKQLYKGWGVNHQYLELGNYYDQMKRALEIFDISQVKWLLYEDFKFNPDEVLQDILNFLEIQSNFQFDFTKKSNAAGIPRNKWLNKIMIRSGIFHQLKRMAGEKQKEWVRKFLYQNGKKLPVMTNDERQFLIDFYKRDVEKLSGLLGFDFNEYWQIK